MNSRISQSVDFCFTSVLRVFIGVIRGIYRRLPLPVSWCIAMKRFAFQHCTFLVGGFAGYKAWIRDACSGIREKRLNRIMWVVNDHDLQTQKYRVLNYAQELSRYSIKSIVVRDSELAGVDPTAFDFIVFNRIAIDEFSRVLAERCKKIGIPTVYDIDDLVFDPEGISLLRFTMRLSPEERELFRSGAKRRRELMLRCDVVTTSTFALSEEVRRLGLPAFVLPNTIARNVVKSANSLMERATDETTKVRIGYFSGTKTHEDDFACCVNALVKILDEFLNVDLILVGHLDIPSALAAFGDRILQKPLMSHQDMLMELSTLDINLAPLELNNAFTDCKSELKIFEAAIFGIPTVASPTSTFSSIVQHGWNGFLAEKEEDWYEALKYLILNTDERRAAGLRANQQIVKRFSVATTGKEAGTLYTALINNRVPTLPASLPCHPNLQSSKACLTVVSVLYGKRNEVRYFLESLRRQDFPGQFEVLLVDDHSPDDSVRTVQAFVRHMRASDRMRVRILRNPTNIGNCGSRNKAVAEAVGELVVIVDADCMLNRSYLLEHYRAFLKGDCDVAIGPMNIETDDVDPFAVLGCYEADSQLRITTAQLQDPVNQDSFVNCITRNFSIRKQFLQEGLSGRLFDERFSYSADAQSGFGWEDIEMGCRLYRAGARIHFLPKTFSIHVTHPPSTDDGMMPLRSLRNFRLLHETHPDLASISRQWTLRTHEAIVNWAHEKGLELQKNPDHNFVEAVLKRYRESPGIIRRHRPLRVLSYRWHCAHQYELYRTGHEFTLVTGAGTALCDSWDWDKRPIPNNARFARFDRINPKEFDVAILHFDENVQHPEKCQRQVPPDWGATFRWFLDSIPLPKVAVCHGTPQFAGQYDADYKEPDLGVVDETSRCELVNLLGDILVVCNSHQARREWGFKKSTVVWHGFAPHDYPLVSRDQEVLTMLYAALRNRPHYNGLFVFEKVKELLKGTMTIDTLNVPRPLHTYQADTSEWAEAKFRNYTREIGRYSIYLNPTLRSPMPRSRGEAMMAGLVTVNMHNHDVDLFVQNGVNGFFAESAEEMAEQLKYLKTNPASLNKMSVASRETALDLFNQDRYLAAWTNILQDIAR